MLPYLVFTGTAVDPTTLGVPPYVLNWYPASLGALDGVTLITFVCGLVWLASFARRLGLGRALRIGEE